MAIKPLGDRILIKRIEEAEQRIGSIIVPDSAREKPQEALVVAVGPGKVDDNGNRVPMDVKKGDKILISKYGGTEVQIDGKDHLIMRIEDVLAVID
jgi:chaperonin GroES